MYVFLARYGSKGRFATISKVRLYSSPAKALIYAWSMCFVSNSILIPSISCEDETESSSPKLGGYGSIQDRIKVDGSAFSSAAAHVRLERIHVIVFPLSTDLGLL